MLHCHIAAVFNPLAVVMPAAVGARERFLSPSMTIWALPGSPRAISSARVSHHSSALCRPSWTDCRNSGCSFCQLNKDRAEMPILAAAASAERPVAMASIIISPNSGRYAVGRPPGCLGFSAVLGIRGLYHGGGGGGIRGGSILSNRPVQKKPSGQPDRGVGYLR